MGRHLAYRVILDALYFSGSQVASRFWLCGLGAILMLHRVSSEAPDPAFAPNAHLSVTPDFLDGTIATLKGRGCRFVSLDAMLERLAAPPSRGEVEPWLAVTLDDGYRDNLENAVPVFRRHEVPYTIYVAPGLVDGRATLWWEDLEAVIRKCEHFVMQAPRGHVRFDVSNPGRKRQVFAELVKFLTSEVDEDRQRRMIAELSRQAGHDPEKHRAAAIMNWREIVELSRDPLCTIGAHTVNHFALARLEAGRADAEMVEGARIIEMETGRFPRHFAYPYGYPAAAGRREFGMAREAGFASAVTTRHGVLYGEHRNHAHSLPRISLNGNFQAMRYVDTALSGLPTRLANRGRALNVG